MTSLTILGLMYLLIVKHYIVDYIFQSRLSKALKTISGDPGGITHSIQHGLFSGIVFMLFFGVSHLIVFFVSFGEIFVHYGIDWMMTSLLYKIDTSRDPAGQKNLLEGFDDVLHYLTYVLMILICSFYIT